MPSADAVSCDSFVSIAFLVVSLVVVQTMLNLKISKRKEILMKQVKTFTNSIKTVIISSIETIWAIGTSITATVVLTFFDIKTTFANKLLASRLALSVKQGLFPLARFATVDTKSLRKSSPFATAGRSPLPKPSKPQT